jgi:peptide/nickel transport system substrate-binding protein
VALTFTIRPDARWGDGTPVSTADALFAWEVGRHPQSGVGNAEMYRRMERLDVVDDKTFTIHDAKLSFNYNAVNDFRLCRRTSSGPCRGRPRDLPQSHVLRHRSYEPGLVLGPYRIASIQPGSRIDLERNPTWWGEAPAFERVTVKAIENTRRSRQPARRRDRPDRGLAGPLARPGAGVREAPRRPVSRSSTSPG